MSKDSDRDIEKKIQEIREKNAREKLLGNYLMIFAFAILFAGIFIGLLCFL